ncbi:helix-turn-helix domain-containing protein [Paenibacillus kobensis]|uniref:helix-turn-helix domain-containing protein n=1 Tax=Paenibacillus kobensis TaxID=59841 RepID=UPI000FD8ECFE|nr:MarR family transcriptional regulator [Paenibacillus kobensis]
MTMSVQVVQEREYQDWLEQHAKSRKGEAKRRLAEGHGYAEKLFATKVWLPAVGHFDYLHPEYEVKDFGDQLRFLDFAYIRPPYRICIEIDGFGPHARDANRRTFADGLMRQNRLTLDDWIVFRFSVDDIEQHPRKCQQLIMHILGKWYSSEQQPAPLTRTESELLRHVIQLGGPVKAEDVAGVMGFTKLYTSRLLKRVCMKGYLAPVSKDRNASFKRVRAYTPIFNKRG